MAIQWVVIVYHNATLISQFCINVGFLSRRQLNNFEHLPLIVSSAKSTKDETLLELTYHRCMCSVKRRGTRIGPGGTHLLI